MIRCSRCVMPNTRPDSPFVDGVCPACLTYEKRPQIDWEARETELVQLLDRHHGRVLVPSSGGKDSTYQVLTLLEMGVDVTIVTARTCHLTTIGRHNIDNLSRYARTIEVAPNMTVRAKLNRLGLEMVGDISHAEHMAIFSTPFRVAAETGHSLIMYGECSQAEYGGPMGSEQAKQMTKRWVHEFGGLLGLRPDDFVGIEGITERDMQDYTITVDPVEAHFLGQYIPWDSRRNAKVAEEHGMQQVLPSPANWWRAENLDNAQTGIHDRFMWLKYGFGRGCQQISVDVRAGNVTREHALTWVSDHDHMFPWVYAGVPATEILDRIGVDLPTFNKIAERFTNRGIHAG
jgi:hypothetical protein